MQVGQLRKHCRRLDFQQKCLQTVNCWRLQRPALPWLLRRVLLLRWQTGMDSSRLRAAFSEAKDLAKLRNYVQLVSTPLGQTRCTEQWLAWRGEGRVQTPTFRGLRNISRRMRTDNTSRQRAEEHVAFIPPPNNKKKINNKSLKDCTELQNSIVTGYSFTWTRLAELPSPGLCCPPCFGWLQTFGQATRQIRKAITCPIQFIMQWYDMRKDRDMCQWQQLKTIIMLF